MGCDRFVSLSCTVLVSLSLPLISLIPPANAADTTVGVCEAKSNTVRIYNRDGQLKLRIYDRIRNVIWMDGAATKTTNPEVVEYRNMRGETTVIAAFNRNSTSDCSITAGGKLESGRVIEGNPTSSIGSDRSSGYS